MISIPDDILKERFNAGLLRGNVLRTLISFPTQTIFKRLLLLNTNFDLEDIYYFLTTSSVKWYIKNKEAEIVKNNCIFIKKGETTNNQAEDTVIDCRKVYIINKSDLFHNYKNHKLDFLEKLSQDIINRVDNIIMNSKLIAPKYLSKIIYGYHSGN